MKLLIDLQYFSPVVFYKKAGDLSHIVFEQYENYRKMSFRNRCMLAGANGPIILSIPLLGGRNQQTIFKDVRIANRSAWQSRHWQTIASCYNRSPWFEYYRAELETIYQKPFSYLQDWNLACFEWMMKQLGLNAAFEFTAGYQPFYDSSTYADWRNRLMPKSIWQLGNAVQYRQVFEDRLSFIPNLSILDLLFCEGKNANWLLNSVKT